MPTPIVRHEPRLEEVKRELQALFKSPVFAHSARQVKLLEYLCNKVLLGESEHIKATTIAIDVFGRPCGFDESKDAIVRVEAHRLRKKLAKYYDGEGAKADIRIVLAPGRYIPEFVVNDTGSIEECDETREEVPRTSPEATSEPDRKRKRPVLLVALSGLAVLALVGLVFFVRGGYTREVHLPHNRIQSAPLAVAPPDREIRILAGQTKTYTDRFGRQWGPDRYFTGGAEEPGPKDFYGRPPDAGIFGRMRSGEFSYDIPAEPGEYELRLYWAEPIFRLANESNGGGENERRFNVSINGKRILSSFDVVADSGISPVDIRSFRSIAPDRDGRVHVQFTNAYGTPFVNALELLPTAHGHSVPIRIRAHELSFTDHEGNVWSPDNYYIGGRLATHKEPVTGTADPELYDGERYGNFSYAIPVSDGKYVVTLYFAETWFRPDSNGQDHGGKGTRIFDVYCNGTTLVKDLDLFAKVGSLRAMARTYHDIRPNGQGKILLSFSPSRNYAAVKAIQVVDEP